MHERVKLLRFPAALVFNFFVRVSSWPAETATVAIETCPRFPGQTEAAFAVAEDLRVKPRIQFRITTTS